MIALAALLLAAAPDNGCLRLLAPRAAGEPVSSAVAEAVPCPEKPLGRALRYNPQLGANVALLPLGAGDVIQGASLTAAPVGVKRGDKLALSSRVGPVTIERPVTALQTARAGDKQIFVKTDDGEVFAVAIEGQGPSAQ